MNKLFLGVASAALFIAGSAMASPAVFTDLGTITSTSSAYATPDLRVALPGISSHQVLWFRFNFAGTSGTTNFLDIDTTTVNMGSASSTDIDTEIGLYSSTGARIADDDDSGQGFYSRLSFGSNAGPRTYNVGGGIGSLENITLGGSGALASGTYWLAVGKFNTTFGNTNWDVDGSSGTDNSDFDLNFRTNVAAASGVPEPGTYLMLSGGLLALGLLKRRAA